jgi:hypothetical protein
MAHESAPLWTSKPIATNLLQAAGTLDRTARSGRRRDLENPDNAGAHGFTPASAGAAHSPLLALYDFPEATMHSPSRETTTTPLQTVVRDEQPVHAGSGRPALARSGREGTSTRPAKVRAMYRKALARDGDRAELARADQLTWRPGTS